ncbi:MAG: hypothetical protein LBR47_03180 [Spirochaetaceae bacterium]|jgi:predicted Holliday junction resolvase-like endonuclease|nr:hypothetical protein [Spirochaetaceae bacterium]
MIEISRTIALLCCFSGGFFIIILLLVFFRLGTKIGGLTAEKRLSENIAAARSDAVKRSRAVLNGQLSEQLAPWFPAFPAEPSEIRFVGKPVDYIAFSGCSGGTVEEILFIEVKTGSSALSPVEKELKRAVEEGRIRYIEYRIPSGNP